jgi:hypothetical protein
MKEATALLEQVLSLPEHERARIANRILESLDPETQKRPEIEERDRALMDS